MKSIRWLFLGIVLTVAGCAIVACAAPPAGTNALPKLAALNFTWAVPTNAVAAQPYWYNFFTNDILVATYPQNVISNSVPANYGLTEHAVNASNAAGWSASATYTTNIPLPVLVSEPGALQPSK